MLCKNNKGGHMEFDLVYTTEEVAQLLKCHPNAVRSMEDKGILHRLPYVPGVKFSGREVARLLGKDSKYEELLAKYNRLERLVKDYQTRMARISVLLNMGEKIQ